MTNCKINNCPKQALYYIAYSCINQHVADTTTCREHLQTIKQLVHQKKFRCSQCPKPIISGLYQPIHATTKKICVKNLNGQTTRIYNNPKYTELIPPEALTALKNLIKCPCPGRQQGHHKLSCHHASFDHITITGTPNGKITYQQENKKQ